MPKLPKNVTRLNTPTKARKPTKASKPTEAAKPIAADKPEDLTEKVTPIKKPSSFSLNRFKTKGPDSIAGVETLLNALPIIKLSEAKDFVMLHNDEGNYWSSELCFVEVPIKGDSKRMSLHLIEEELATNYLDSGQIKRFRLALASKPDGMFFLAIVPSRNKDNSWNESNLKACRSSTEKWTKVTSRRDEGVEAYKIKLAVDPDAFPKPEWPSRPLAELIEASFADRVITDVNHPAMLRLLGRRQVS